MSGKDERERLAWEAYVEGSMLQQKAPFPLARVRNAFDAGYTAALREREPRERDQRGLLSTGDERSVQERHCPLCGTFVLTVRDGHLWRPVQHGCRTDLASVPVEARPAPYHTAARAYANADDAAAESQPEHPFLGEEFIEQITTHIALHPAPRETGPSYDFYEHKLRCRDYAELMLRKAADMLAANGE